MSLVKKFRKIHRQTALMVAIPLFVTALTGIAFGIFTNWFGLSEEKAEIFLVIHQGEYLGNQLKPIYVAFVGLGMVGMIITGLVMSPLFTQKWQFNPSKKPDQRQIHRLLAPILFLPLIVSTITGVIFRLGRSYFGLSKAHAQVLMAIHQGKYLGSFFQSFYLLLVGLGLILLVVTGIKMTSVFRQKDQLKNDN
jgi:uncharacterized iron-regulated membrane protein